MEIAVPPAGSRIQQLGDRVMVTFRPRRSRGTIAFLVFWLAFWTFGGIAAFDQDVFINAVGGVKITEPAADLAVLPDELPSGPVKYELEDGRLVVMPLPGGIHGAVNANIVFQLKLQGDQRGRGQDAHGNRSHSAAKPGSGGRSRILLRHDRFAAAEVFARGVSAHDPRLVGRSP